MNFIDVDYDLALWITPRAYFKYLNTPWYLDQASHWALNILVCHIVNLVFVARNRDQLQWKNNTKLAPQGQSIRMGDVGASKTMGKRLMYDDGMRHRHTG